jgi:hypothetical protein
MTRLLVLVAVLLAGLFLGSWAALWWRDHVPFGQRRLLRHVYAYADDRIGATKTENIRRANRRFHLYRRLWFLPRKVRAALADFFWPVPQLGTGTAALPSTKRMGRYVQLELRGDATFRKPYRLWNIHAVVVRPTSEVDALAPGTVPAVARWVAWAMRLPSTDQLEIDDPKRTLPLGYLRFARKAPAPEIPMSMPVGVNADG